MIIIYIYLYLYQIILTIINILENLYYISRIILKYLFDWNIYIYINIL